jgi:hypothetical protein
MSDRDNSCKRVMNHVYAPVSLIVLLLVIGHALPRMLYAGWELPLEFHGRTFIGKYLNSDTSRYNMDASVDLHCTLCRFNDLSLFVRYRDDLDMAQQTGGVSLDPRYAHYYIAAGFNYIVPPIYAALHFTHDCVHDIDIEEEGTPVFNRFRLECAAADMHPAYRLMSSKRFLWRIVLGIYPHWSYHGWDINDGADYQYELILTPVLNVINRSFYGVDAGLNMHFTRGDSGYYHQHLVYVTTYCQTDGKRIGARIEYNIKNNDVIKDPDKLWLLSLYVEF